MKYEQRGMKELRALAKSRGIRGYSTMNKADLIETIRCRRKIAPQVPEYQKDALLMSILQKSSLTDILKLCSTTSKKTMELCKKHPRYQKAVAAKKLVRKIPRDPNELRFGEPNYSIDELDTIKMLWFVGQYEKLPKEIVYLDQLEELYLSSNKLKQFPKEILDLKNIRVLDLTNNELKTIPKEITKLTKLHTLNIPYNQLTQLPKELAQLSKLKEIRAHDNELKTIPRELANRPFDVFTLEYNRIPDEKLPSNMTRIDDDPEPIISDEF